MKISNFAFIFAVSLLQLHINTQSYPINTSNMISYSQNTNDYFIDNHLNEPKPLKEYFLVLGDYLADNTGQLNTTQQYVNRNFWVFNSGKWVHSNQTLPGGSEHGGSIWWYFAKNYPQIPKTELYFMVLTEDQSNIYDWTSEDSVLLNKTLRYMRFLDNIVSLKSQINVLWVQGIMDSSCRVDNHDIDYGDRLISLINKSPERFNWGISKNTYSPKNCYLSELYIRDQQSKVIKHFKDLNTTRIVWQGVDNDKMCNHKRYHKKFLSIEAMEYLSRDWIQRFFTKSQKTIDTKNICDEYLIGFEELLWITIKIFIFLVLILFSGFSIYYYCNKYYTKKRQPLGYSIINSFED